MCENYHDQIIVDHVMFAPDYTITPNILKAIASIEYNRSVIENASMLPNFENRLAREISTELIVNSYKFMGESINSQQTKAQVDKTTKNKDPKIQNIIKALSQVNLLAEEQETTEKDLKKLHKMVADGLIPRRYIANYRNRKIDRKTDPEEILAELSELVDWMNSLDAMDTNPVIAAGIVKGQLEIIYPFEYFNFFVSSLLSKAVLYNRGYLFTRFTCVESYYESSKRNYEYKLLSILEEEGDLTTWLEYYTEGVAAQTATAVEKVKLLAKDTKLAKTSGRVHLSQRQEKIVEYLQDYGILQNKQFSTLFPNISEDTVLRDLRKLINSGMVVKRGSTKSSRYELG